MLQDTIPSERIYNDVASDASATAPQRAREPIRKHLLDCVLERSDLEINTELINQVEKLDKALARELWNWIDANQEAVFEVGYRCGRNPDLLIRENEEIPHPTGLAY